MLNNEVQLAELREKNRLMTAKEVATTLRIGQSTVYHLIQRGDLPCVRIGRSVRVRPADLDRFIEANTEDQIVG